MIKFLESQSVSYYKKDRHKLKSYIGYQIREHSIITKKNLRDLLE
jgi:hypothetical protein